MTPDALAATYARAFPHTRAWTADEFTTFINDPRVIVTGDTRSFVLIRIIADEAEVLTFATDPAYQRQGLGRSTLQAAHAGAASRGAVSVFLEVAADNVAANALYAGLGYTQVGQRKAYYTRRNGPAVDAYVLQCALAPA